LNLAGFYQINHARKLYFFEKESINAEKLGRIFDDFVFIFYTTL